MMNPGTGAAATVHEYVSLSLPAVLVAAMVAEPVPAVVGVPVMACERDVVWVAGYRIHRDWAVPSARAASWKVVISRI